MPINNLLTFPFGSYLMVRLDYVVICGDELEAKIMRIIEMYMEDERKIIYKALLNDPRNTIDPQATIEITKDVWPAISHRLFKNDLYDQEMAENTLKRAIKSLKKKRFIKVHDTGLKRYESPSYQIDTEVVQAEFEQVKTLGKAGYQKLMVSKIDGIKKSPHQKMTPSGYQNLTPSSTSRVSKFDPNSRRDYEEKIDYVEESTDASASAERTHTPFVSQQTTSTDSYSHNDAQNLPPLSVVELLDGAPAGQAAPADEHAHSEELHKTNVVSGEIGQRADGIAPSEQKTPPRPKASPPVLKAVPPEKQSNLLTVPLSEPRMIGPWDDEKCVQYAEWHKKRRYTDKMRPDQLTAARLLHKEDSQLTLEQFKLAFDDWHPWWTENRGPLNVSDLRVKQKNGVQRYQTALDRLEMQSNKSRQQPAQRQQPQMPKRMPTREELRLEVV